MRWACVLLPSSTTNFYDLRAGPSGVVTVFLGLCFLISRIGSGSLWDVCSVTELCLTLCDPMDCNLLGSSVHGNLQTRMLEWVAISSSRGSPWPRERTPISCNSLHWRVDSLMLSHQGSPFLDRGWIKCVHVYWVPGEPRGAGLERAQKDKQFLLKPLRPLHITV